MIVFILKVIIVFVGLGLTLKFFIAGFTTDKKQIKPAIISILITCFVLLGISIIEFYLR